MASVVLTLTTFDAGADNFTIYHTSNDYGNQIAENVTQAELVAGWCTDRVYPSYVLKSNTAACQNEVYLFVALTPTPTPGPSPTPIQPTPTPTLVPTSTPVIGPTPVPTSTSVPTATPITPTATPVPTSTPGPTPTPVVGWFGFYATIATDLNADPCANQAIYLVYTQDFTTVADMVAGDRIYRQQAIGTELDDNFRFAVSDTYNGTADKRWFLYSFNTGVGTIAACASPTAVPPTPTPTPPVFTINRGDASATALLCGDALTTNLYARSQVTDFVLNTQVFSDTQATTPFVGGNSYYRLQDATGNAVWAISNSGFLTQEGSTCGTTLYDFYGTLDTDLNNDACLVALDQTYYTYDFANVTDIQNGDVIYDAADLSSELTDNKLFVMSNISASNGREAGVQSRGFKYSFNGGVNTIISCTPATGSFYGTTPTSNGATPACNLTLANTYYLSTPLSIAQVVVGTKLYTNSAATTELVASDQWVALGYNPSPETGEIVGLYTTGLGFTQIYYDCDATFPTPTPTSTPIPTPTPTPIVSYEYFLSLDQTTNVACWLNTGNGSVWTEDAFNAVGVGTVLYTDQALTTTFDGNDQWWGLSEIQNTPAQLSAFVNNAVGSISTIFTCGPTPTPVPTTSPTPVPTSTPTPTPTPIVYNTFTDQFGSSETTACLQTMNILRYTADFSTVANMIVGDRIYRDANLALELNDNTWFRISDTGADAVSYKFRYFLVSGVNSISQCAAPTATPVPTAIPPTPVPSLGTAFNRTGTGSSQSRCAAVASTTVYLAGTGKTYSDFVNGAVLYADDQLVTPINVTGNIGIAVGSVPGIRIYYDTTSQSGAATSC